MRRLLVLSLLACALLACGDGFVPRPTTVVFEPASTDFWAVPLPSELRRQDDGTYNLERWPGPRPDLVKMWLTTLNDRVRDGWGVNAGVFFDLSGGIDSASLPASAEASLDNAASVYFLDIDEASPDFGKRLPVEVKVLTDEVPLSKQGLLAVVPAVGFTRRTATQYAVLITDGVKDAAGTPLGRSRAFHDALEPREGADARAVAALKPLRDYAAKHNVDMKRVVGATVFRTIDPMPPLERLAAFVDALPAPQLAEAFTLKETYPDFFLYVGAVDMPQVQLGDRPGEGRIVWTADGTAPVQQGTQRVRLSLSIPKAAPPPEGYPLVMYLHGSGGEYLEAMDRGPLPETGKRDSLPVPPPGTGPSAWLGRAGYAMLGFDFPLHGDRMTPPDTTGLRLYNLFGDVDTTIDNMNVSAMEVTYLSRLVQTMSATTAHGATTFDATRLMGMGQSMGSTVGIPVASVDQRFKGWVFSGAGGLLIEIATGATYPVKLKAFLELLLAFEPGQTLTADHPLLHAFQTLWDLVDPSAKARFVAQAPRHGRKPVPALQPQGFTDGYFNGRAQAATAGPLGATLVGDELEPVMAQALRRSGRPTQAYPLKGNVNGVTVGTFQVSTQFELGHYVVFDREPVQHQVRCFLDGVGTSAGPSLVAPAAYGAPCQ